MQPKRVIKAIFCGILLCIIIAGYHFFHVSGKEIEGVLQISDVCTVTVVHYQTAEWNERTEYHLNSAQIQKLKQLILESSFRRTTSSIVRFYDHDMYDIVIEYPSEEDVLSIHAIGNEYLSVTNQFAGHHLKIRNPNWKADLESILSASE